MPVIDLRSDTVTKPTEEMRAAMAQAEVGDDVMGEDPTVNRLEQMAAELLGKEAGLLTSSGTMSNLIAALSHCRRGDEVIMGSEGHMFWNEVAGAATLAAVQVRTVPNDAQGRMDPGDVEASIRPPGNIHFPRTSLLCLENTHNRCNGGVLTPEDTRSVSEVAHANGVAVHLDGARVFNAAVALEVPAKDLVADVDDVSFCLSKGLSAPVGSVLCGSQEFVEQARKWRKMLGGGMRQAGVIAAAGVVALETMVDRLAEDHSNASRLASGLSQVPSIRLDPASFQTNIVFLELEAELGGVHEFISRLNQHGLKVSYPGGRRIRLVTHRHISPGDVEQAVEIVAKVAREQRKPAA